MENIIFALICFAGLGAVFGILLAVASRAFAVKTDPRVEQILECLPGANCGGCGEAGCAALAEKIAKGERKTNSCAACSFETIQKIAEIAGAEAVAPVKMRAQIMCAGCKDTAAKKYNYEGEADCNAAMRMAFGDKFCQFACVGLGTCISACQFDAISVKDGIAVVDFKKCTGCGACTNVCPKHVIKLIPYEASYYVQCSSRERGVVVRSTCNAGCIACGLCQKACEADAITVENSIAKIDYEKCTGCGKCAEKCPRHIIHPGIKIKTKDESSCGEDYIVC